MNKEQRVNSLFLRLVRAIDNSSQSEFAKKSNLSQIAISKIELGERGKNIYDSTIDKIYSYLINEEYISIDNYSKVWKIL